MAQNSTKTTPADSTDAVDVHASVARSGITPERMRKLEALRAAGKDPFGPETFDRTHLVTAAREQWETLQGQSIRICGRVVSMRGNFVDLLDEAGRGQFYLSPDDTPDYQTIKENLDLGDFLGIEGHVFETKKGDKAVHATQVTFLAKALRDVGAMLGKEYVSQSTGQMVRTNHLTDPDLRQRMRYVDLFVNREARDLLFKHL